MASYFSNSSLSSVFTYYIYEDFIKRKTWFTVMYTNLDNHFITTQAIGDGFDYSKIMRKLKRIDKYISEDKIIGIRSLITVPPLKDKFGKKRDDKKELE